MKLSGLTIILGSAPVPEGIAAGSRLELRVLGFRKQICFKPILKLYI
jgi:hypothetical protein